ncbi:response regulator [Bacillus sp. EB106-08-02-XG196]|jgi:two-component system, response regulator YesN|uniref:response regulator transcription factor n=1 Tax=Bacillus sp. EB106-08-02-XG196 TaxID=2737049 RepID=UPI0015C4993A|nr:response regulator [Bacillus sp. EB106-08-02-XG196]NWQ41701.1 response regulator [Bacillus sp. EB106-08-02-XG196]
MLKAVIFDDEFIVIEGLKRVINWTEKGIEIIGTATDGISGLSLFYSEKPDIIFTDIRMPGINGLKLIEEVMDTAPDTICVVMSGHREFEYVKQALKIGVADYLVKPITIQMIEETIDKIKKKKLKEQSHFSFPLNHKHEAIEKACKYIYENYNKEISLQEVADFTGLNPNYFSILFKDQMGKTYIKYLTELRMEKAKLMLQEGQKVIKVSEKVGYHTYRHFSDIFKKYVGVSPGQYKKVENN